jgi:acetyltransferase-like isoleucine patch superfamily enzyme
MRIIINRILGFLGKKNYKIDEDLRISEMFTLTRFKLLPILRGCILKVSLKSSKGIIFLGENTKIKFKNKITFGRTTQIGDNVEINALSRNGVVIGDNFSILKNSIIECTGVISELGEGIVIGNNVGIAQNCFIQVRGRVIIGNNVIFGPNVSIFSENHNFEDISIPIKNQGTTRMGVIIEDDVWLGSGSKVLDGVKIGHGSIIAAGAIVNHNVPPFSIVGGIPGKVLKYRM